MSPDQRALRDLSLPQQRYVETIHGLCENGGHAHVRDIAERLNIRMPSVTEALRGLREMGLIYYEARQAVTLTERGAAIGAELGKRHQALAEFFRDILGCLPHHAETIACRVEHEIDDEFRERLTQFMRYLKEEVSIDGKDPIRDFKEKYNERC